MSEGQESERVRLYFRYLIERGALRRWGHDWRSTVPEREFRLGYECRVIEEAGFCAYFLILARILGWCHEQKIITGPARGSVGGSLAAFCLGIHELDSLRWDLSFERFMNPERVSLPDVDIDVSQRHRDRVLTFIREEFEDEHTAVLQIPTFARAGARRTIDMVLAAKGQDDPSAGAIAEQLRKLLPEGTVTGGMKVEKEIEFWLENGKNQRNQQRFRELAEKTGWMELLTKLDGVQTHLAKHAAGVVIVSREDLARMPQTTVDGETMMTGYDMYSLDEMKYLKIDVLGLRNLDVVSDAHRFCGGDGSTEALMELWEYARDEPEVYDLLTEADTLGVFQSEGNGYRKYVKEFQPREFEHVVQLNALNRPGTLDAKREDGKNMLEIFIDRMHGREPIVYPSDIQAAIKPILDRTQGIIPYQEQSMKLAVEIAGFTPSEADNLRKAIGKKQLDRMQTIEVQFAEGMKKKGYSDASFHWLWDAIKTAARYQFNRCVSGDTVVCRAGGSKYGQPPEITLRELYAAQESNTPWGRKLRNPRLGIRLLQMDSDGRIRPGKLRRVIYNGVANVWQVTTADGHIIRATANHRFLTIDGYRRVDELRLGQEIITQGAREPYGDQSLTGRGCGHALGNSYTTPQRGFPDGDANPSWLDGRSIVRRESKRAARTRANGRCESCATLSDGSKHSLECAHVMTLEQCGGDYLVFHSVENIQVLCNGCHKSLDYAKGERKKRWTRGLPTQTSEVVSIKYVGQEDVYDVEMDTPEHNFIANGIVSHNSHSFAYSIITWWTAFCKATKRVQIPALGLDGYGKTAFYCALTNSLEDDKERQADVVAEARQHVTIRPPDINVAMDQYTVDGDAIVFGFNGIKGMGEASRYEITLERMLGGPYRSFEDFHRRLPSVGIDKKLALVRCGALDDLESREWLLSQCLKREAYVDKKGEERPEQWWTVAEFIKHNCGLKKPRSLPMIWEVKRPTDRELADGEVQTIGFYLNHEPFGEITQALSRLDPSSHWGGEVIGSSIKIFNDKYGGTMARFTLLTTSLNKQCAIVFASNYAQCRPFLVGGQRVVVRGHMDGSSLMVDRMFQAGRYDHHKVIRLTQNGRSEIKHFDGRLETIEAAEAEGWMVTLV